MPPLRLKYQTIEFGKTDIHLCSLRDRQQFDDPEGIAEKLGINSTLWPIFGQIWPSSLVLAHFMNDYQLGNKRVLEIGCGMALPSLLLRQKEVNITATDYHPEVGRFLDRNIALNADKAIDFMRVDWAKDNTLLGLFDVIIGSDLLYEDEHIDLLANFIAAHASPVSEVILVDPGRGRKTKLSTRMTQFGYDLSYQALPEYEQHFKGHILKFKR